MTDDITTTAVSVYNTQNTPWFVPLVEDCKAIITEGVFTSRWALVETYWMLGKRIEEEVRTRPINVVQLLQELARDITVSHRTVYYAHSLYLHYPDIQKLPEGKNISWTKLIKKYLPENRAEFKLAKKIEYKPGVILVEPEDLSKEITDILDKYGMGFGKSEAVIEIMILVSRYLMIHRGLTDKNDH